MVLDPLPEDRKFPGSMRDDVIPMEFEIDFDRRPLVQGPQNRQPEEEQFWISTFLVDYPQMNFENSNI